MSDLIAWGYVRISQEGRETSIADQKSAIRKYAKRNDLTLQTTQNDGKGTSGFNHDRTGYQTLLSRVKDASIDAVIVRDRARLSRDFDERMQLILLFRSVDVDLHVIETGGYVDIGDIQQAGVEAFLAAMDHLKKMAEIERAREVVKQRKEDGCYQGKPPFGLRFAEDNCHLEKDPNEWETIEAVWDGQRDNLPVNISRTTIDRLVEDRGEGYYDAYLDEFGK